MRVLVTGGAGFIGSHVVDALLARGDDVIAVDILSDYLYPAWRKRRNLVGAMQSNRFSLHETDITDAPALLHVFRETQPEAVIHLAGMAAVGPSVERAEAYTRVNVLGTVHVLDAAHAVGIRHFVLASSSTVYGNTEGEAFREEMQPAPLNPYGASKVAAEAMGHAYHHMHGFPVTALRFFNAYGPRVRADLATYRFVDEIHRGVPIQLRGDGTYRRDYTYVADTVSGVLAALDTPDGFRVFNLGNEHPVSVNSLIAVVEETVGKKAQIERQPTLKADSPVTCADNTRARAAFSYRPQTNIRTGIARLYAWYLEEIPDA